MRQLPSLVLPMLLIGCAVEESAPVELAHVSVLKTQTRGMALSGDGTYGHAGMMDVTCDFTTRNALVGGDYDFLGARDTVADGTDLDEHGFTTVTLTEDHAHVTLLDQDVQSNPEGIEAHNVVHSRITRDFVAVIREGADGCEGGFVGLMAKDMQKATMVVDLPPSACDSDTSVAVNREDNELYIATNEGIAVMTQNGWHLIEVTADLVAWDPWSGALYAAERDGAEVRAVELDGSLRWSALVDGDVQALNHLGKHESAVVIVARGGAGAIVVLDGASGTVRTDLQTPSAATNVVISDSGGTMGVQLVQETHFYDVSVLE